jgi:3',5'-cyclic AMP phosphodiesterase CpdA
MLLKAAHLSDLHFGSLVSPEKVEALASDIKLMAPNLVIITGDITDRGYTHQFRRADEFLSSLETPFISVPGNREISFTAPIEWMIPRFAMTRYSRYFGRSDRILFESECGNMVFFGLNSVHPLPSWPGTITRESRYWLKEQAARYPNHIKALFLHHPVVPVIRGSSYWAHCLSDAGEILNICTQTGIKLLMQGHKHRASVMEINVPEREAKVVTVAGGAPLMPFWDAVYHFIEISQSHITVQPREFIEGRFKGKESYRFGINESGREPWP